MERLNRVVKAALQTASKERRDWTQAMRQFLMTYRSTPHATTGRSPSELLHGRQLRTMLHAATPPSGKEPADRDVTRDRVVKQQQRQKAYWDRRYRPVDRSFRVGDWVRYRLMPVPRKGRDRFSSPHRITGLVGPSAYRLNGGALVHAERLARWTGPRPSGPGEVDCPVTHPPPEPSAESVTAPAATPDETPRPHDVPESPATRAVAGAHSAASGEETARQSDVPVSPVAEPVARGAARWYRDDTGRLVRE